MESGEPGRDGRAAAGGRLRLALLSPVAMGAVTLVVGALCIYARAKLLYTEDSFWGQAAVLAPLAIMAVAFFYQIVSRRFEMAFVSAFFTFCIWVLLGGGSRMFAETYVWRTTWHSATAALPNGMGTITIRTRGLLAGSWCPLPPGGDSVWSATIKTRDGRLRRFGLHHTGWRPKADVLTVTGQGQPRQFLMLRDNYGIALTADLATLRRLPDSPEPEGLRRKVGRFDWSEDGEFRFTPAGGGR